MCDSRVVTNYKVHTISRVYARINEYLLPNAAKAIADFRVQFGDLDAYELIGIIGSGKYSLVFLGRSKAGYCAIKVLRNIAPVKIKRELFILDRLSGSSGVVKVLDVNKDDATDCVSIVTEFIRTDLPRTLYASLSIDDIRYYAFLLLGTLDQCHQRGIMHRDIKPGNVCIDHRAGILKIIDWGLSEFYYPMTPYSVRVATLRYKAPELLLGYRFYDYGIDVWGAGLVLAEMLTEIPFIDGETPEESMGNIAGICGEKEILNFCEKYGVELPPTYQTHVHGKTPNWDGAKKKTRKGLDAACAWDLIQKMLVIDHEDRITVREALMHKFFAPIFDRQ